MRSTVNEFDLDVRVQAMAEEPDPEAGKRPTRHQATCPAATCGGNTCAQTCSGCGGGATADCQPYTSTCGQNCHPKFGD
jgi:hypothetical protein